MIEEMYVALWEELTGWCRAMAGDRALAEELVQEAFLRAMQRVSVLEELVPEQRRAWMYRTVKNLYLDRLRRMRRHTSLEGEQEAGLQIAAPVSPQSEVEWLQLLECLPDMEGMLFSLRYLQGYNSTQIGKLLSIPPGTVRSKLSSARRHLREMIGG